MAPVTAFFAGWLALLYLALSVHVIARRYKLRVRLGDGGDENMTHRIRAHGNFAEYVPFALILMGLDELNGSSASFLKLMGAILIAGRLLHAFSLTRFEMARGKIIFRQMGMVCTFTVIIVLAVAALTH